MNIKQKRIRNVKTYLGFLKQNTPIVISKAISPNDTSRLLDIGFICSYSIGDTVLPSSKIGPISLYNAEGKYIPQKHLPKETAYREMEWHWEEYNGPYDRTPRSRIVDVPYKRYPRKFLSPPSIELSLLNDVNGNVLVTSPEMDYDNKDAETIKHTINLFLELFGECDILYRDLTAIIKSPSRKLNWTILPPGIRPWIELEEILKPILDELPKGNKPVVRNKLRIINQYGPNFTATGQGGFRGYIIFGFEQKGIFVCESIYYGNATYLFDENWEELSKKTKAEILNNDLQLDRIIHRASTWKRQITKWLK